MKLNILRIILIVMLLLTLKIIFSFSNQNGNDSGSISKKITKILTNKIEYIQKMDKLKKEKYLKKVEHIVRKIAHFSIYALCGILLICLMLTFRIKNIIRIGISFSLGLIYAISDEIHQSFIPGRSAQLTDVLIDTSGVIFGIVLVLLIYTLIKKKRLKTT